MRLHLPFVLLAAFACVLPVRADILYGVLNNDQDIVTFDTAATDTIIASYPLSGFINLSGNATDGIYAISVRSDTGQLYGVSGKAVYTIDANSGQMTAVAPSPITLVPGLGYPDAAAFEPNTANLFVISISRQLLEVNVTTGAITNIGSVPGLEGLTWGTLPGSTQSTLYGFNSSQQLLRINPATGAYRVVGSIPALGVSFASGAASFTFSTLTATAYLVGLQNDGSRQNLYTVDLETAGSSFVGVVDHIGQGQLSIAAAVPEPNTALLTAGVLAIVGLG